MPRLRSAILVLAALLFVALFARAGEESASWTFDTYTPGPCSANGSKHGGCPAGELVRIHVVTVAYGLVRPWHITFLPGGTDMLVTELPGNLRIVRGGKLDPTADRGLARRAAQRAQHELRRAAPGLRA